MCSSDLTGGVRVTKHVHTQDEVLEQELRTSHADVKRVKTNRVVDGPRQPPHREGNTLIIPVVSEILRIEKQWVVTEEIHITEHKETETVQQTVPVRYEQAHIERLDDAGNAVGSLDTPAESVQTRTASQPSLVRRAAAGAEGSNRRLLSDTPSLISDQNVRPRRTRQPRSQPEAKRRQE
ncbi:MAG: DUF2382 domain-containing protein [Acidobacteriaceae bacterium]|nr:DUF2382 domain-containing protein [Acidobacteriaceae bacterium]